ncbi:MAG: hypothetical protein JNL38_01045 [Myxococcales bacterium]|nr:hypothetical protein [Myxococcales bacterium]
MRSILVLVTLAAVGACSSTSTSSDGEPTPTRTDGGSTSGNGAGAPDTGSPAEIVATAECDAMAKCDVYGMSVTYGDYATCVQRRTLANGSAFSAPKHAWVDAASARACAAALAAEACHNGVLGNRHHVDACRFAGALAKGAACSRDGQCQSGACTGSDTACGTCTELPSRKLGEVCNDTVEPSSGCRDPRTVCSKQRCVALLRAGEACDRRADVGCEVGLDCVNDKCTAQGTEVGAACDPNGETKPQCSRGLALVCDAGTCQKMELVAPGGVCNGSARAQCRAGRCEKSLTSSGQKVCYGNLADGAACKTDLATDPLCMPPARCMAGNCRVPTPADLRCD